jgi:type II secretory pathway pseudopilin PulG
MVGVPSGAVFARITEQAQARLRNVRSEAGFTLIEVLIAGLMIVIIGAPLALILTSSAALAGNARERTTADQLAQTSIETIRTLSYSQVGISGGNPDGDLTASTAANLPSGEQVHIGTVVDYIADAIPGNPYPTNADYKKVVLTVTRDSDGAQLAQKTTFIASASAPPLSGSDWVQVKRTAVDVISSLAIPGASVHLTGGPTPTEDRTDVTDTGGNVLFPALASSTASTPPNYTLATTPPTGYLVFPDDIAPGTTSVIPASPGANSVNTIRMYKTGISLTVNVQDKNGAAYTGGTTIYLDSSRCGATVTIPSGSSSGQITTCSYTGLQPAVGLPPNVTGQLPLFDKYYVTGVSGGNWSPAVAATVPSAYPTTLTQTVTVKFSSTTFSTTKAIQVTVTKAGSNDKNARVEVTGNPTGLGSAFYIYGTTNSSGVATINVPVISTATTYTINANDMGVTKGTGTTSLSTSSGATTNVTVAIS